MGAAGWSHSYDYSYIGCGWFAGDSAYGYYNNLTQWHYLYGGTLTIAENGLDFDNNHYNLRDTANISALENGVAYLSWGTPFTPPWEEAGVQVLQVDNDCGYDFNTGPRQTQTRIMIVPAGQTPAGGTNFYLVRACAAEFSNPNSYNLYYGDVPLPPEWLQINEQPLANSGLTNANGAVWGYTVIQAPMGANADVTPVATQVYHNWDYTFDVQAINFFPPTADNNRDGQIALDGSDGTTPAQPFRFWMNDTSENGDIASGAGFQIPGSGSPNYSQSSVQGRSDLVNFFPVVLCLSNVMQWLPLTNGFEYHLSQTNSAVKFVYTTLTPTNAFDYLTNTDDPHTYGVSMDESLTSADTVPVAISGANQTKLDTNWLTRIQNNGGNGVLLMEGCAVTTNALMLEIWHKDQSGNNKLLGGVPLYLNISGVEQMFRHKNLRDGADAPGGLSGDLSVRNADASQITRMDNPQNNPDASSNGNWFVFVVGSNVGGQNTRGWEAEVFKRMYWSGSKAKFVGVSWYGDPYTNSEGVYDYHMAVRNAFATAPVLASFVNGLGGNTTIAGHSLGCGLIASAIADQGMNVNNACLMDAAFAQECFDGDADDNLTAMQPSYWQGYDSRLFAAYWHERFDASDARSTLTWRNRFAGAVGKVYNFYSSTEDCLGEYDGNLPINAVDAYKTSGGNVEAYVWAYQEKAKGNRQNYYVIWPGPGHFHVGSTYGGWGFNIYDGYLSSYPIWYVPVMGGRLQKTSAQIGTVTQDLLDGSRYNPLFLSGWGDYYFDDPAAIDVDADASKFTGPSWILGLYDPVGGNTIVSDPVKRAQLLAEAIPALSKPVGANPCGNNALSGKQYDMASQFADSAHWDGIHGKTGGTPNWWHSDMDQVAYPLIYKLYNTLVSISNQ